MAAAPRARQPPSFWRLMFRGFTRRCPLCGGGRLFEGYFRIKDRCPRCNLPFRRTEGQMIGALGVNTIVTFGTMLVLIVAVVFTSYPDIPALRLGVAAMAIGLVMPIAFYPLSWTVWAAVDLAMRPVAPEDRVVPEWVPARRPRRRR